ncbi:Lipopolysaccharide export system permease protein LptG [invertebrate metagenome]|uniref:Lipopolysaccharide export system permease protein LptG n=1 Tax=invertebrate metagenome TaxID=1711999 RepID=A0A2H9T6E6_9ZZZZ
MGKLDRYIGLNVLLSMLGVLLVLVLLESLFSFLAQLDDVRANYQVLDVALYIMMLIPTNMYNLIPVSSMIGCIIGLGSMASFSELTAMRAAGVSIRRIVWSVIKPALLMVIIGVFLGEYIAPATEQIAETQRSIARSAEGTYSGEGVWHRQGNEFMYFNAVEPNGVLYGISRFDFDDSMRLQASSYAKRAIFQGNHWILEDVTTSRLADGEFVREMRHIEPWKTDLTTELLKTVVVSPDGLPLTGLSTYIDYLEQQGLVAEQYKLAFWTKALQPLSVLSLVLVGISFIFGPLRSVSMGLRLFSGVITGVVFMLTQSLLGPSSLVFGFPAILSVLIPVVFSAGLGLWLLKRVH